MDRPHRTNVPVVFSHLRGEFRPWNECLSKPSKPCTTESPLLFDVDPDLLPETMKALGGARLWWYKCFDP